MPRGANAAYGADGLVRCRNFPEFAISAAQPIAAVLLAPPGQADGWAGIIGDLPGRGCLAAVT